VVRGGQQELQRGVGYGAIALFALGSGEFLRVRNAEPRDDEPHAEVVRPHPFRVSRPLNVPITDHASRQICSSVTR